jgi:hypothetical protein
MYVHLTHLTFHQSMSRSWGVAKWVTSAAASGPGKGMSLPEYDSPKLPLQGDFRLPRSIRLFVFPHLIEPHIKSGFQ